MIAVDSSVLVDVLRGAATPEARAFRRLAGREPIAIGDIVLLEVLRGASSEERARAIEARLRAFDLVTMRDDALAVQAAAHYRRLRALGVTIRGMADLVIAAWCIARAVPLLQRGRDFAPLATHCGLRLVSPGG
nr:PIN domain-containing protein [Paracraurococcus ruber]